MEWLVSFALKYSRVLQVLFIVVLYDGCKILFQHVGQYANAQLYGTIADWVMIVVTLFAGVFAYRAYKTQSKQLEVSELQFKEELALNKEQFDAQIKLQQEVKEEQLFQILIQDIFRLTENFPRFSSSYNEADLSVDDKRLIIEKRIQQDAAIGMIMSRISEIDRLKPSKLSYERAISLIHLCCRKTIHRDDFEVLDVEFEGVFASVIGMNIDWLANEMNFLNYYVRKVDDSPLVVSYVMYYEYRGLGGDSDFKIKVKKMADKYSTLPPELLPER